MVRRIARELLSGVTVAIVALPLAIAFGITATGSSQGALVGLYGAIFAGFFAAVFGGTPGQVTGPTGPITVVAAATIGAHGLEAAFVAFILAGALQILFGLCRLGSLIRYIPHPVISGFMGGIAIIIIVSQSHQMRSSFLLVVVTIVLLLGSGRLTKAIPPSLIVLVLITSTLPLVAPWLRDLSIGPVPINRTVEYIGEIPEAMPSLNVPQFSGPLVLQVLSSALAIALLGSLDSLLTSLVMDNITGTRHRSNKELIGQGIGNIASGLFGGLASAGATVRSVVNNRNGGRTALSAATHSVVLFAFVAGLGAVVQFIPLAVLSGILILTAVGMFDWKAMRKAHVSPKGDVIVLFTTMVVTVVVDLTVAVLMGVTLALLVHALRSRQRKANVTQDDDGTYFIDGPLSFLSVDGVLRPLREGRTDVTLNLQNVSYLDTSGAWALLYFLDHCQRDGHEVSIATMPPHVADQLIALADDEQRAKLEAALEA
ncbi:SulP family inorganic anion transporter [Mycobacterium shinjukuense]|uniref:Sodium-independent anion transporter n=1 Tax=Mycobacterium shinjukuense TaxID=398694 RepID=A0A7I7MMY3_9MYCO|nr:SulP family inorganic anion transporter [Mycobacterium shinjukuense]MCV6986977.1 SulP family inorganic anion transporter [Mycobacterium shinjukuense]ORB71129.1 sulfate transporter [Mycobacterium shinjukuense]BBX73578.1 sodium-independent anion transporter [Mycobacterium shinjukuense]